MQQALTSGLATSLLQVLMLIFAGFATVLVRIYETKPEDMEPDGPEILGWVFMSYSIIFIYPIFILTLALLTDRDSVFVKYVLYLLGAFISTPVLILSSINFLKGWNNDDNIQWRSYQRVVNCVSGISVWIVFLASVAYFFLADIFRLILYHYL